MGFGGELGGVLLSNVDIPAPCCPAGTGIVPDCTRYIEFGSRELRFRLEGLRLVRSRLGM